MQNNTITAVLDWSFDKIQNPQVQPSQPQINKSNNNQNSVAKGVVQSNSNQGQKRYRKKVNNRGRGRG